MTRMIETRKIYISKLFGRNEQGSDVYEIDCSLDVATMKRQIGREIGKDADYIIMDHENFHGIEISEYMSLRDIANICVYLNQEGKSIETVQGYTEKITYDLLSSLYADTGGNVLESWAILEDRYCGAYNSPLVYYKLLFKDQYQNTKVFTEYEKYIDFRELAQRRIKDGHIMVAYSHLNNKKKAYMYLPGDE